MSRMVKKMEGNNLRCFKEPLLCAAIVQKRQILSTRLLNDLKNHGNRIIIFSHEKTFTVDNIFSKQNDLMVTFRNAVSEHRRVSTTKHPASITMFGAVESNGVNMPPLWFQLGYRLTSVVYKKILEMTVLPWVKKFTKKSDYVFQKDREPRHMANTVQD